MQSWFDMSSGVPRATRRRIQRTVLLGREVSDPGEAQLAIAHATLAKKQRALWMGFSFPFILVFGGVVSFLYDVKFAGLGLERAIRGYVGHPFEFVFWVNWTCIGLGLSLWQRTMATVSSLKNEALLARTF